MTDEAPPMRPFTPHFNPWRRVSNKRTEDTLKLSEIVVLRRLVGAQSQADVARSLDWPRTTVNSMLWALRKRFEVETNADLLALPRVAEQLSEDGAA